MCKFFLLFSKDLGIRIRANEAGELVSEGQEADICQVVFSLYCA